MPDLSAWSLLVRTICRISSRNAILRLYRVSHGTEVDEVEVVRGDARTCRVLGIGCLIEEYFEIVVVTIFRAFPSSERKRVEVKGRASLWSVGVGQWEGQATASYK